MPARHRPSGFRACPLVGTLVALALAFGGAHGNAQAPAVVTFVHFSDIHEVNASEGGRVGGVSRVATALRELRLNRAPVIATLGGDYLSPSAIGTARAP